VEADFLVIGGGIAGTSVGARLAELGRVVLVEAESALGYHASGRSAALFEVSYGLPTTVALNRASADWFHASGLLAPRGLMLVGGPGQEDRFAADAEAMGLTPLTPAEARAMVPILHPETATLTAWHDAAWDIDTDRMIQAFAREVRASGEVVQGARVSAIRRTGDGWAVTAGGREIAARVLVNAAGAWADGVAEMAGIGPLGIRPMRRSMARLAAPGGHDVSRWPMLLGVGEDWYAKPDAGALLVSPAEEEPSPPMDAWADDMVLAEGLARYEAHVTEPVTRPLATWAGLRSFAPDRTLVLGPDPRDAGFVWMAGQGGYGFQTAPAASRLVADRVAGRAPALAAAEVAALAPDRFVA
jgi:glycine/D-amino acid oxidase-like deaminating enzyme